MKERIINEGIRETVNEYLGYELIKPAEVGNRIFEEAPGLGKVGIEGTEHPNVVTAKFLDANGNIEWHKNANPMLHLSPRTTPFHCKLTSVSSKKAKLLIAALFPDEITDKEFIRQNQEEIRHLVSRMEKF